MDIPSSVKSSFSSSPPVDIFKSRFLSLHVPHGFDTLGILLGESYSDSRALAVMLTPKFGSR